MKHKKLLIAGTIILAVGLIITFASLCAAGFDADNLNSSPLSDQSFTPQSEVHSLILDIESADLTLIPTDGDFSINYQESKDDIYEFTENDGTLTIKKRNRPGIVLNFFDKTPLITLYIPNELAIKYELIGNGISADIIDIELTSLRLSADGSNISLRGIAADMIEGDFDGTSFTFEASSAESLRLESESGTLNLSDTTVENNVILNIIDSKVQLRDLSSHDLEIDLNSSSLSGSEVCVVGDSRIKSVDSTVYTSQITSEKLTTNFDSSYVTLSVDAAAAAIEAVDSSVNATLAGTETDYTTSVSQIDCFTNISPRDGGWRELDIKIDSSRLKITFDNSGLC